MTFESLNNKSSLEVTEFYFTDLISNLVEFGIQTIDPNQIILKPYLLKPFIK